FSFDKVSLGGPVFDVDKLLWLNGVRIRAMKTPELARRLRETLFSIERIEQLVPLIRERMDGLGEFPEKTSYFTLHKLPVPVGDMVKGAKSRTPAELATLMKKCAQGLDGVKAFEAEALEAYLKAFCEEKDIKIRELFMAVRIAITGRKATPPLFETMEVLGRAAVTQRLLAAADLLRQYRP
ncbi:MAG: glutamate--tRNA ligase, partial [Deltaproteobacteria bacterium]|nr:glutamate--tRNA ligase [Deltaproteobacteria bacterium]